MSGAGENVGGLVGDNWRGTVSNSYSTGDVSGTEQNLGGLVGYNVDHSKVSNSYSTGNVSGSSDFTFVGGLVGGTDNDSEISNSYSTGDVSGVDYVGGLVGYVEGYDEINNSYSTGDVSATEDYVGGLVGWNEGGTVSNSYATGSVSGSDDVGGLVGFNKETVSSSYSTGSVSGTGDHVGGLVGKNSYGTVNNSFWDTETSGQSSSDGGTGKTTTAMQNVATFTSTSTSGLSSAWDFETNPYDDTADNDYWDMDLSGSINNGYPYLSWQDGDDKSLPVELSSFTANASVDGVTLKWRTETETNNLGFYVYRSDNKEDNFTKINNKLIKGQGTSAIPHTYSFTDETAKLGQTYYYYIEDTDYSGKLNKSHILEVTVGQEKKVDLLPKETVLMQNYPNPFNPETWIPFKLSKSANVVISIYDVEGQLVRKLELGQKQAGIYTSKDKAVLWDGRNSSGEKVSSGVYFYTLQAGDYNATKRMLILK